MNRIPADFTYYSMPRSGTTLLRLVINSIFVQSDKENIVGGHEAPDKSKPILCNIRDFRDVVVSLWRIRHAEYDNGLVINKMNIRDLQSECQVVRERIYLLDELKEQRMAPVFFVRYEQYWNNVDLLINQFGEFFGVEIPDELRTSAKENADRAKCKAISNRLGYDFDSIDEDTDIHGMHIYTNEPGTWKVLVERECYHAMNLYFQKELERWGYESI